nr:cuticle protein 38-like [Leptinotarsa decemlineata]
MNSLAIVAFFAALAASSASVIAPSARIIQGPSARATVAGPDGSIISSVAPGGQIVAEDYSGYVAHAAPVVAAPVVSAYASLPAYTAYSAPVISSYSAPVVSAYTAPSVVASGVVAQKSVDSVVAGPSGTIATSKTVATPAIYAAPAVYAAHGVRGLYL